jgi:hypothetical protein
MLKLHDYRAIDPIEYEIGDTFIIELTKSRNIDKKTYVQHKVIESEDELKEFLEIYYKIKLLNRHHKYFVRQPKNAGGKQEVVLFANFIRDRTRRYTKYKKRPIDYRIGNPFLLTNVPSTGYERFTEIDLKNLPELPYKWSMSKLLAMFMCYYSQINQEERIQLVMKMAEYFFEDVVKSGGSNVAETHLGQKVIFQKHTSGSDLL